MGVFNAPGEDYAELEHELNPDWNILNHHYWQSDIKEKFGTELDGNELERAAHVASSIFGEHPEVIRSRQLGFDFPHAERTESDARHEMVAVGKW